MDNLTKEQRRKNMKAIRSKDTSIEIELRKALWHQGIRYRKNYKGLIGKPDIVLTKYKLVIFCDSDFWHGYNWEVNKHKIKSNLDYWIPKIERNMKRDKSVDELLKSQGWIVIRFWEHEIRKNLSGCIGKILSLIFTLNNKNIDLNK